MIELVVQSGPDAGRTFVLVEPFATIGRDLDSHVVLSDPKVSRRHARLSRARGRWMLQDLESRNGTFVGGKRISGSAEVDPMAGFRVGATSIAIVESRLPDPIEEDAGVVQGETVEVPVSRATGAFSAHEERSAESLAIAARRIDALLAYEAALRDAAGMDALLARTAEAAGRMLSPGRFVPVLAQGEAGRLHPWLPPGGGSAAGQPISASIVRRALSKGAAVLVTSASRGEATPSMSAGGILSAMAVPASAPGGAVSAVLYADRRGHEGDFTREDLDGAVALSVVFGRALASLGRVERAERKAARLEREILPERQIVGGSAAIRKILDEVERVARTDATVLVTGESGTGKDLVARAIHRLSARRDGPFEAVNCGALPEGLAESELFGHVKGAFTGATSDRLGRFELADEGTLFLDEVGELSAASQARLLRAIEAGAIRRVGEAADRAVRVRVVAATHRDLDARVREGAFRQDLLFRLNVVALRVPPLRERLEDLEPLCAHLVRRIADACGRPARPLSREAFAAFRRHRWPGNVRELRNVLERMIVLSDPALPELRDVPPEIRSGAAPPAADGGYAADLPLEEVERRHIAAVLSACGENRSQAAAVLGIDRSTLYAKLKRYRIDG